MKKIKVMIFGLFAILLMTSCACQSVDSGHKGVEVSWGGKTNMEMIYPEGMTIGFHWVFDHMEEYDIREKTLVHKFDFNDKNNMLSPVEFSLDYSLMGDKVNVIHSRIGKDQLDVKILSTLSSAAKQVVPQYSASELNLSKRDEAEKEVGEILKREFPPFYVNFSRIRITDVDIPKPIADAAVATARQAELNKLADSKAIEAENNYHAAEWNAKTNAILSQPAMLDLKRLDIQMEYARKGVSPYGSNNVFGVPPGLLLSR